MYTISDGGGGPRTWSGPNEEKLYSIFMAGTTSLEQTRDRWKQGKTSLVSARDDLKTQADSLRTLFGQSNGDGPGDRAAAAYMAVVESLEPRIAEVDKAVTALDNVLTAIEDARTSWHGMPTVTVAEPGPVATMTVSGAAQKVVHEEQKQNRNARAGQILRDFESRVTTSSDVFREIAGEPPVDRPQPTGSSPSGPLSQGQSVPSSRPHATLTQSSQGQVVDTGIHSTPPTQLPPVVTPPTINPNPETETGNLQGPTPGQVPTSGTPGPSVQPSSGSTAGVGPGVAGAIGGAAVAGAGAIAASRPGAMSGRGMTPGANAPAKSTKATLGRSASARGAASGALGRNGMLPGSGGAGRGGAAGSGRGTTSSGRGAASIRGAAGGRTPMMPGTGGTSGKGAPGSGGRGAPGGRTTSGAGRGMLPGSGAAGRGKGDKDAAAEHFSYEDQDGWLDDDATTDQVID